MKWEPKCVASIKRDETANQIDKVIMQGGFQQRTGQIRSDDTRRTYNSQRLKKQNTPFSLLILSKHHL